MDHELFDPSQFSQNLAAARSPTRAFKNALRHASNVLKARFEGQRDIHKLIHDRAWLTDQILRQAWATLDCPMEADIALLAVGGYGRGELHPHSDIDLLILLRDGSSGEHYHEPISRFLTLLWDIGLEVGHAVRSISECQYEARSDVTVITNLMESRMLVGEPQLRQDMIDALGQQHMWTSAEFFRAKRAEQQARHAKFNDTEYNLEPNVKSSPGGLRDIQTIGWVALRHFGTNDLRQLVEQGFVNESEYSILTSGRAFLWQVRFALHSLAGRAEDRLLFDHQRALARLFGFEDNDAKLAVERFMQKYYRIVMSLSELNDLLMQHFEEILLRDAEAATILPLNS
ncbi:MAG: [protein-PII] uridylyltransferase, partial [Gammaproteobacteria bacterium]|nr:[protein-PII] uridylyltransferase [Gammaproteobacteria bacterium]